LVVLSAGEDYLLDGRRDLRPLIVPLVAPDSSSLREFDNKQVLMAAVILTRLPLSDMVRR